MWGLFLSSMELRSQLHCDVFSVSFLFECHSDVVCVSSFFKILAGVHLPTRKFKFLVCIVSVHGIAARTAQS
jgi:hypothetical protein